MSANGKLDIKEGDVVLERDGYLRLHVRNSNGVWHDVLITPKNLMWVNSGRREPLVWEDSTLLTNIKDMLIAIRDEVRREPSN